MPVFFQVRLPWVCIVLLWTFVLTGFRWSLTFGELTWEDINSALSEDYPTINRLSVEKLKEKVDRGYPMLVVDVRTREEFDVSHLPHAIHFEDFKPEATHKDTVLVAYCSVGLRSAEYIQTLQETGFSATYNLQGSIFAWANSGYPLESFGHSVDHVHPYNDRWGRLLKTELHWSPP